MATEIEDSAEETKDKDSVTVTAIHPLSKDLKGSKLIFESGTTPILVPFEMGCDALHRWTAMEWHDAEDEENSLVLEAPAPKREICFWFDGEEDTMDDGDALHQIKSTCHLAIHAMNPQTHQALTIPGR